MCGLCGVLSTSLNKLEVEAFQNLMIVSTLRGAYGSGIVAVPVSTTDEIQTLKHKDLTAAELAHSGEFYSMEAEGPYSMMMGHARQPTKGGLSEDDAHPHVIKDIIGMHNGTMSVINNELVPVAKNKDDKVPSDSALLFKSIADHGITETIMRSVGSYAIQYIDKSFTSLNFLRNKDRTLYWAQAGQINSLFWASEADMLTLVLKRLFPAHNIKIYRLTPDMLVSFKIRPVGSVGFYAKRELKQKGTSVVPFVNPAPTTTQYRTKQGHYFTEADIAEMLLKGCAYCGFQYPFQSYSNMYWTEPEEFVCPQCVTSDPLAKDYVRSCGISV